MPQFDVGLGDAVIYGGPLFSLNGKLGHIREVHKDGLRVTVMFDHDQRARVINLKNLIPEGTEIMSKLANFKTVVGDAVAKLLTTLAGDSIKEQAVRKLGVASELVRLGEASKKSAKKELTDLGIIGGVLAEGTVTVFDSQRYRMDAVTKAASQRLDQTLLKQAMTNEGVPHAKINRIIKAATVDNAAATSYKVEVK